MERKPLEASHLQVMASRRCPRSQRLGWLTQSLHRQPLLRMRTPSQKRPPRKRRISGSPMARRFIFSINCAAFKCSIFPTQRNPRWPRNCDCLPLVKTSIFCQRRVGLRTQSFWQGSPETGTPQRSISCGLRRGKPLLFRRSNSLVHPLTVD